MLVLEDFKILVREKLKQNWIKVEQVNSNKLVERYGNHLDKGEAEAIALAKEKNADYLLIDEKIGRQIARDNHLKIIGTVGILLEAKRQGLIDSVKNKMDDLRKIGFWISDKLYDQIVKTESESI